MGNHNYLITQEQLAQLLHFQRMFELTANNIENLCAEERDPVVYGFELGKIHSNLRQHFMDFMVLEDEIKKQYTQYRLN